MATVTRTTVVHGNPGKRKAKRHQAKRKSSHRARPRAKTSHRARTKPARKRNLGALYALTANPAKGHKKMAHTKKRKSSNPKHRRAGSARSRNPGRTHHRRRSNPGMFGYNPKDLLFGGVGVIAGVVGTRALPQLVLGGGNTGVMGYVGNAVSVGILTAAAHFVSKNRVLSASVLAGGVASILSRVIQDLGLLGPYSSAVGLGDYLFSDFFTPQRLADGLHNAQIDRGSPSIPVNVSGAGAGVAGIYGGAIY